MNKSTKAENIYHTNGLHTKYYDPEQINNTKQWIDHDGWMDGLPSIRPFTHTMPLFFIVNPSTIIYPSISQSKYSTTMTLTVVIGTRVYLCNNNSNNNNSNM